MATSDAFLDLPVFHSGNAEPTTLLTLLDASSNGLVALDTKRRFLSLNKVACDIFDSSEGALLGQDMLTLVIGKKQEIASYLVMPSGQWSCRIVRPRGEEREIACTHTTEMRNGHPLTIILFRDVTETQRLAQKTEVLTQFAAAMTYATSLEGTLNALSRSVVKATGIMACLIPLISGNPLQFRVVGSYGLPNGYAAALGQLVQAGTHPPALQAFSERRTIVVGGIRERCLADPSYAPVHGQLQQVAWDTVVSIPLIYRGTSLGVFTAYYPPDMEPTQGELVFLSTIADQAAIAVKNAQLLLEAQDKAALVERQRLARELHDSVSQALYGIVLGVQSARSFIGTDKEHAIKSIDYALSLAKACHTEMRALIFSLRPESLEIEGLVGAITKHAAAVCERYEVPVETSLCDEPDIPLAAKEILYRITQEALHNIVKHAHASHVQLLLQQRNDGIVLEIQDDGVGFDPTGNFHGHMGLHSMRERANQVQGKLEILSTFGGGTCIRLYLPAPVEQADRFERGDRQWKQR
jgi:signal transduction histidine kinase